MIFLYCCLCKTRKLATEFHKDKYRKLGFTNKCKQCTANVSKKTYLRNRHTESYRIRKAISSKKWQLKNRLKTRAHSAVHLALKTGKLINPKMCERCGDSESRINAHHSDYKKPLKVKWLCVTCHEAVHHG